jgi:hypothetical protein
VFLKWQVPTDYAFTELDVLRVFRQANNISPKQGDRMAPAMRRLPSEPTSCRNNEASPTDLLKKTGIVRSTSCTSGPTRTVILRPHSRTQPSDGGRRKCSSPRGNFLSYVLSFVYIGIYWKNHHQGK